MQSVLANVRPEDATPMEILARTGGERATDTFHVVDAFEEKDGRCEGRPEAGRAAGRWQPGMPAADNCDSREEMR